MSDFSPRTIRDSIAHAQLARGRRRARVHDVGAEPGVEPKDAAVQTSNDPQTLRNARMIDELRVNISTSQEELRRLRRIDGVPSSQLAVVTPVDLEFCRKLTAAELQQVCAHEIQPRISQLEKFAQQCVLVEQTRRIKETQLAKERSALAILELEYKRLLE